MIRNGLYGNPSNNGRLIERRPEMDQTYDYKFTLSHKVATWKDSNHPFFAKSIDNDDVLVFWDCPVEGEGEFVYSKEQFDEFVRDGIWIVEN
jgi:hypothetical protein